MLQKLHQWVTLILAPIIVAGVIGAWQMRDEFIQLRTALNLKVDRLEVVSKEHEAKIRDVELKLAGQR